MMQQKLAILVQAQGLGSLLQHHHGRDRCSLQTFQQRSCILLQRRERRSPSLYQGRRGTVAVRMGLRGVDTFDGHVTLDPTAKTTLMKLLTSAAFCKQVASNTKQPPGTEVEFTGDIFQPAPWTPTTRKGMPAEFEKYHEDPAYVFINVPPNFMFNAKIYKPSRLCAIYKVVDLSKDPQA